MLPDWNGSEAFSNAIEDEYKQRYMPFNWSVQPENMVRVMWRLREFVTAALFKPFIRSYQQIFLSNLALGLYCPLFMQEVIGPTRIYEWMLVVAEVSHTNYGMYFLYFLHQVYENSKRDGVWYSKSIFVYSCVCLFYGKLRKALWVLGHHVETGLFFEIECQAQL